ncbi:glycerophosphodiester phosphodiesterase family protein [Vibrio sp. WJH972]
MKPRIVGHRGASGSHPENTRASIMAAIEMGVNWVEIDVQPTKDNVLVICHDHTIDRCSDGHGRVDQFTYGELLQFDFGAWFDKKFVHERIMTLEQLLILALEDNFCINIEVKIDDFHDKKAIVANLTQLLERYPDIYKNIVITSFNGEITRLIAASIPQAKIGILTETLSQDDIDLIKEIDAFSCHINYRHLNKEDLTQLKDLGVETWCFTVNRPSTFPLLDQVESIFTDFPNHFMQPETC